MSKKENKGKRESRSVVDLIKLIKSDLKKNIKLFTTDELVKILKKLSDVYYNTEKSIVDDEVYDKLRERLENLDPENPFLEEVGAPIKGTKQKIELPFEMGSSLKVKMGGDVEKFMEKYPGKKVVSDKLDGASVQIYKKGGKLKQTVTLYSRGNGKIGQDISHLIKFLINDEILENLPENTSVRGELIISKKDFEKISSYMKNARNAVSGLVNSKTIDVKIGKITQLVTYSILYPKYKQSEQMKLLEKWGFKVVNYSIVEKLDDDILKEMLLKRKNESEFEIDGLVCVDDSEAYEQTGGYPDHLRAFKMLLDSNIIVANVVDIEWDISMDGYVKPRVRIEPVNLMGTTITYATGFNAKFIEDNKLGKGAKVKLVRSGDVIPYILQVVKPSNSGKGAFPDFKYKWNETKIDIIVDKKDKNGMKLMNLKLLIHFFSTMGIKYLGEGILKKFMDAGLDTIPKIISAKKKDFIGMEGVGDKMIKKIYDEIHRAFNEVDLATFMGASHKFGRGMGVRKIEEVLMVYPDIIKNNWSELVMIEKIKEIQGFAEKTATLFAENFKQFMNFYNEISEIIDLSRFENHDKITYDDDEESEESESENNKNNNKKSFISGKKIVFTGFRDKNLEKTIKLKGGKVSTSVSSHTNILVHADNADESSSKFTKAKSLGVKIISLSDFKKEYIE